MRFMEDVWESFASVHCVTNPKRRKRREEEEEGEEAGGGRRRRRRRREWRGGRGERERKTGGAKV